MFTLLTHQLFSFGKDLLMLTVRGGGVPLCLCLLTRGVEGGENREKVAYVICECSLILLRNVETQ